MKKLKFLAFMLAAVFTCAGFTSCGDDDDDDDDNANSAIVGTWVGKEYDEEGYVNDPNAVVTMTFTSDNKMTAKAVDSTDPNDDWAFSGTYTFDPNASTIAFIGYFSEYPDEVYDDEASPRYISIRDNIMIIFFDGCDYKLYRQ